MRRAVFLATGLAAAACTAEAPPPLPGADATSPMASRAAVIGQHVRAALACGIPVPRTAQDRAAAIEAATLEQYHRQGGPEARDAYLAALAPPAFEGEGAAGRRAAWCTRARPDIARVTRWLDGAEGAAFVESLATRAPQ